MQISLFFKKYLCIFVTNFNFFPIPDDLRILLACGAKVNEAVTQVNNFTLTFINTLTHHTIDIYSFKLYKNLTTFLIIEIVIKWERRICLRTCVSLNDATLLVVGTPHHKSAYPYVLQDIGYSAILNVLLLGNALTHLSFMYFRRKK